MQGLPSYLKLEIKFAELMYILADNGIYLDQDKVNKYISMLSDKITDIDKQLVPRMPKIKKELKPYTKIETKSGALKKCAQDWINSGNPYNIVSHGDITMFRWEISDPNPNSAVQLRDYLLSLGWIPSDRLDAWNYKTEKNKYGKKVVLKDEDGKWIRSTPKIPSEDWELEALKKLSPSFQLVADRLQMSHRLGVLKGYLKNVRDDGRIPMKVNSCGCNTLRVTHSVTCNVPKVESYFGKELRSVFRSAPGKVMVGADMSGQEACILAHLLNDPGFTKSIVDNKFKYHRYFYEVCKDYVSSEKQQKGLNFAYLYGARDPKLGSLCDLKPGNNKAVGAEIRQILETNVPNLDAVQELLLKQYRLYGAIQGLDGRWIKCRKESALLNTYCQSGGAICSKIWTCRVCQQLDKLGIEYKLVIFMHDEIVIECESKDANRVAEIMLNSISWVGKYLNLNIALTGDVKIGKNWAEVH